MLDPEQIQRLHPLIVSNFSGNYADQMLANFSFLRVGIPIEKVTAANNLFDTKVLNFLQFLQGPQIFKALNELKLEYPNNDELESAIDGILEELKAPAPSLRVDQPIRKLLVANGRMDTRFAPDIKKLLQDVMEGWQVVGSWEIDLTSPNTVGEHAAVIALLAKIVTQKTVTDPPLSIVKTALRNLNPQRLVLLAHDPGAFTWIQEQVRAVDSKEFVETEPFFGQDGKPIFFTQAGEFRAAEIEYRVKEIGMRLYDRFQLEASQPATTVTPSIIVLGEPEGSPPPDAKVSIQALLAALKKSGLNFDYWADGWRNAGAQPSGLLVKDPIFIRAVSNTETNTARVAQYTERALRSVFAPVEATVELLSSCRQVLWRAAGPPWDIIGDTSDPSRFSDDLDTVETRVAKPEKFVKWLERFSAPDAVIFHEALAELRPAGLIRVLRETIANSLSIPTREALVRVRAFRELPNFGDDPLTIVAVDDLPIAAGIDFHKKAFRRFHQFEYNIERILAQKGDESGGPAVLRVAVLTQETALSQDDAAASDNIPIGWKALRVRREGALDFRPDTSDVDTLVESMQRLIQSGGPKQ